MLELILAGGTLAVSHGARAGGSDGPAIAAVAGAVAGGGAVCWDAAGILGIEAGVGCSAGKPRKVLPQDMPPKDTGEGVAAVALAAVARKTAKHRSGKGLRCCQPPSQHEAPSQLSTSFPFSPLSAQGPGAQGFLPETGSS